MKVRFALTAALTASLMWNSLGQAQNPGGYGAPSTLYPQQPAFSNGQAGTVPGAYPNGWNGAPGVVSNGAPMNAAPMTMASSTMAPTMATPGHVVGNGEYGAVMSLPPTAGAPSNGMPAVVSGPVPNSASCDNSPFMQAMNSPWAGASCGPNCEPQFIQPACNAGCPRWFGGVYGMYLDMVENDAHYFLMPVADPSDLLLSSREADFNAAGGFETRFGRTFCNCRWGLEVAYWEVFPGDQGARVLPGYYGYDEFYTTMNYQDVYIDQTNGTHPNANYAASIQDYYNNANPILAAEICRTWDIRNIELNLLSGPLVPMAGFGGRAAAAGLGAGVPGGAAIGAAGPGAACGAVDTCGPACVPPRWFAGWLFGVRYFNFNETQCFIAENGDGVIDYISPNDEFRHGVRVSNDLVGVQLGLRFDYFVTRCLQLQTASAFGLYGNNASVNQHIFNGNGPAYTNPTDPQYLSFSDRASDVAFLGELRAGVGYRVGQHWRVTTGYRVLAASGIARSLDQWPKGRTIADYDAISVVDRDGIVILHGAYSGIEFAW